MTLKDLMGEKQLNFNQPLLSIRRGSSTTTPPENERKPHNSSSNLPPLPYYKSDLKSGPFTNPGVVPFKWECIPGRPKDENTPQKISLKIPPLAPKLPPGRTSSTRYRSEINISDSLKSSSEKFLSKVEDSEKLLEDEDTSSSDDENMNYLNSRDKLSRSDSFFNCSVSSMSGLDIPESSRVFTGSSIREFMIDRFLPAAKAVVSNTPSYASRRHCLARERKKPITQVGNFRKLSLQANSISEIGINSLNRKEEDEFEGRGDLSVKFCGLMPRFRMLNLIPGMKDHLQVVSSVRSESTIPSHEYVYRDNNKLREKTRNIRGDPKKSVHQCTPSLVNESLMNGCLGRYGISRHKNASPQRFSDKEIQFLSNPGKPTIPSNFHTIGHTKSDLASNKNSEEITSLVKSNEEKTLYVDFEKGLHLPKAQNSETIKEDMKKRLEKYGEDLSINVKIPKPGFGNIELSENTSSTLALTPFLPKTPSESWLSRTLSSTNPSSKSHFANRSFRASMVGSKRENPLKTSNLHVNFLSAKEIVPLSEN